MTNPPESPADRLTERDTDNLSAFLSQLLERVKHGSVEPETAARSLLDAMQALAAGDMPRARRWFNEGIKRVAQAADAQRRRPERQAKLFTQGGSQAVRLPAEFRFTDVDAVYVRKNLAGDVVLSARPPRRYATFMAQREVLGAELVPDGFLSASERDQRSELRDPLEA